MIPFYSLKRRPRVIGALACSNFQDSIRRSHESGCVWTGLWAANSQWIHAVIAARFGCPQSLSLTVLYRCGDTLQWVIDDAKARMTRRRNPGRSLPAHFCDPRAGENIH